jgi:diaminohydroxyphosphoribosylaminopyrimidine deaminase/5-amino-6-(5-phosphoribosylamino)uracil reductase
MSTQPVKPIEINERLSQTIFMQRCFQLAELGAGYTAPNPMVGAVLVYNGKIIGEGYHELFGGPHAEVNCLLSVKADDRQLIPESTLYVSLEPCVHHGKTPPCTDLIIREKIPRVVIGCRDPFREVNGKGIEKLIANAVNVEYPVLEEPAKEKNRRFFTFHQQKRPYIILKWAESSNHKIAGKSGRRIQISNDYSNRLVHKWRSEEAGILIGTQTALLDNPELTNRLWTGNNPKRIVLDRELRLTDDLKIFDGKVPTIILNGKKEMQSGELLFKKIDGDQTDIPSILSALHSLHVLSILVEGGAKLLQSFIDSGLWDEIRIITNTEMVLEEGISSPEFRNAKHLKTEYLTSDAVSYYRKCESVRV